MEMTDEEKKIHEDIEEILRIVKSAIDEGIDMSEFDFGFEIPGKIIGGKHGKENLP